MQWYTELILLLGFTGVAFFFALAETALLTLGNGVCADHRTPARARCFYPKTTGISAGFTRDHDAG